MRLLRFPGSICEERRRNGMLFLGHQCCPALKDVWYPQAEIMKIVTERQMDIAVLHYAV
jgi:hypothetical protein